MKRPDGSCDGRAPWSALTASVAAPALIHHGPPYGSIRQRTSGTAREPTPDCSCFAGKAEPYQQKPLPSHALT